MCESDSDIPCEKGLALTNSVLSGHKDSVTCLDTHRKNTQCLASGSDDATIRLWDKRTSRAVKCIVSFGGSPIETVSYSLKDENILYSCTCNSLYSFDLRREGILIKEPLAAYAIDSDDEISSASLQSKGEYIALGMDSGNIELIPLDINSLPVNSTSYGLRRKTLSRYHSNIVGCVAFKPNTARDLVSGGFDCILNSWDISTSKPQVSHKYSNEVQEALDNKASTNTNILNPPFVQSVQYGLGGKALIAALGNGNISVHSSKDLRLCRLVEAHSAMATSLHAADSVMCSGGADRYVKIWKLIEDVSEAQTIVNKSNKKGKSTGSTVKTISISNISIELMSDIYHGRKVNAVSAAKDDNTIQCEGITVADTSKDITIINLR